MDLQNSWARQIFDLDTWRNAAVAIGELGWTSWACKGLALFGYWDILDWVEWQETQRSYRDYLRSHLERV